MSLAVAVFAAFCILWLMDPTEQGYYQTLVSIMASQPLELGLGYTMTQFVAHENAGMMMNSHLKKPTISVIELSPYFVKAPFSFLRLIFSFFQYFMVFCS